METKRFAIASILALSLALILAWLLAGARIPGAQAAPQNPAAGVIYVDADAVGPADGLTWSTAFTNVQDALTSAVPGDEIWVAEGVYTPTAGITRTATFQLKNGAALYGGFAATETLRTQRDWEMHVTVLSGDLDGNDITDANGVVTRTANIVGDNAYHVVTGSGTDATAVLDGFTVTAGKTKADGGSYPANAGGGMWNHAGSPTLANVTFSGNSAYYAGGGLFNYQSSPTLTNVTFNNNSATSGGGVYNGSSNSTLTNITFNGNSAFTGGGIFNLSSDSTLANVTFNGNSASRGGGIYNGIGSPALVNIVFNGNSASMAGGGMYNQDGDPTLANVTFSGNFTEYDGGGMHNVEGSPTLANVTFSSNSASDDGGGIYNENNLMLVNCILWSNSDSGGMDQSAQIFLPGTSSITVTYSLVQGGVYTGTGNIDADPLFVRPPDPGDGDWAALVDNDYGDLSLQPSSPAIDKGNNTALPADTADLDGDGDTSEPIPFDQVGKPRIIDIVDMGAYEWCLQVFLPVVLEN